MCDLRENIASLVFCNILTMRKNLKQRTKCFYMPTISKYLSYLHETFVIGKAEGYDMKGRKYISTPSKYHCTDVGTVEVYVTENEKRVVVTPSRVIDVEVFSNPGFVRSI